MRERKCNNCKRINHLDVIKSALTFVMFYTLWMLSIILLMYIFSYLFK